MKAEYDFGKIGLPLLLEAFKLGSITWVQSLRCQGVKVFGTERRDQQCGMMSKQQKTF